MSLVLVGWCRNDCARGNWRSHHYRTAFASTLVASEVKDAVFHDRPTDRATELLLFVGSSDACQRGRSVPLAGPDHHEHSTVDIVCAALGDHARNTRRVTTKLRRE